MKLISIVAASENNVIGIDNKMPWHLPDDLKFFKKTTSGSPVIMGKNTWLSLGCKALPNRLNIIISQTLEDNQQDAKVFATLHDALDWLKNEATEDIEKAFIIGGGQLYKATMHLIDEMFITRVHTHIDAGMVFFPEFEKSDWELVWSELHEADEKHQYSFTFEQWVRN